MKNINRWTVSGRLTRDCQTLTTKTGKTLIRFSIANNWSLKTENGYEQKTNYFDCILLGHDGLSVYLKQGKQVVVDGEARFSSWENKGIKQTKIELIVDDIELYGGTQTPKQTSFAEASMPSEESGPEDFDEGDIPF